MIVELFTGFDQTLIDVFFALFPLLVLFFVFQIFFLRLKMRKVIDTLVGFLLAYVGLALFLQGVNRGFLPVGETVGKIFGNMEATWLTVVIGFILGFMAAYAEPAVKVHIKQVEKVTGGSIPSRLLLYTISIGVGLSIAMSMIKIVFGFSIWYYVLPGYIIAFLLARRTSKLFTAIAFDSGGIVTGPMIATFMLALFVGLATATPGRDAVLDGFGMIALVALSPILSVLILGHLFQSSKETRS
ncbi:Protein of unknown function [Pelagirhabdus alkalitolerans]|uniref:DUF1538 domain-containing protein n=1 Tax=Pelagirhabdus alkalitolerans TaxID=1612202 RepID=A0A1G6L0Y0_9BACI|nr:DUF1538 domain-containing protein [Pelagirhabdus alkalitolerans]SDC36807.1 Protein of unknown function [Pelagirhabdus alkalitolerans]